MRAVFDTNILIDYFNGEKKAKHEIEYYKFRAISIITYMEIIIGVKDKKERDVIKNFLHKFVIVDVTLSLADITAKVRQCYKLKLPDAIIFATAEHYQCLLITRNIKDFPCNLPIVRVPYTI